MLCLRRSILNLLKKTEADIELYQIIKTVSKEAGYNIGKIDFRNGYTETTKIIRAGLKAITISAFPVDQISILNHHQQNDRVTYIKIETLNKVYNLMKMILNRIDKMKIKTGLK